MVYLIDDKRLRQEKDFHWSTEEFSNYQKILVPIYTLEDLKNQAKEIFQPNNTVLYHESFLDNSIINEESVIKRKSLLQFAQDQVSFQLVIFSGSKNSRNIKNNIAHIPVSILYQNLELFLQRYNVNEANLKYLVYANEPEIERVLLEKLEQSLSSIEKMPAIIDNQSNFFIPTFNRFISNPIKDATISSFFDYETDLEISEYITNDLNEIKYDNIFIPLCYGNSLSDYNGLRLASHIRCTASLNQLSRILIYGFVGIEYLVHNEYFNILKTKNVFLIPFSKNDFSKYGNIPQISFVVDELSDQIKKLKLDIPNNYDDSHSIANEWAIYRWANSIEANDIEIEKIGNTVSNSLYFKYLKTIYPISHISMLSQNDLQLNYEGNTKVLYIDDEANKGWYEILCKILWDINGISFECLDDEFNFKNQEEIINISIKKIIEENFDIVILDFRLHSVDFISKKIDNITGFKILKEIKKINPGIQIIIFTATNKIWNLKAMQDEGLDGFILKESPENSQDDNFTYRLIENFISSFSLAIKNTYLKQIEISKKDIVQAFNRNPLTNYYPNDLRCLKGLQYQNLLLSELDSVCDILHSKNINRFNHAMLMQFKIIECLIEIFIPEKSKKSRWLFYDKKEVKYYYLEDNKLYDPNEELLFYDKSVNKKVKIKVPYHEYNSTRNKIDCFIEQKLQIDDKLTIHKKLKELVNYRNSFIHPKDRFNLLPLTSDNIVEWLSIISRIISKI